MILYSNRKFSAQPLTFSWHNKTQKEWVCIYQVNKLFNQTPSLVDIDRAQALFVTNFYKYKWPFHKVKSVKRPWDMNSSVLCLGFFFAKKISHAKPQIFMFYSTSSSGCQTVVAASTAQRCLLVQSWPG